MVNPKLNRITTENLRTIDADAAIDSHERGDIHCMPPARFERLGFNPIDFPWLRNRLYRASNPAVPDMVMICIDTTDLEPEQENVLLARLYGSGGDDLGVTVGDVQPPD